MFTAALFTITKILKQPKYPSVDEWIKQLWDIYTMQYYLAVKKKEILPFVTGCVDLESIILSEISSQRKTSAISFHLHTKSNEQNKQTMWRHTPGYREQTDSCQRGGFGGWMRRMKGLSRAVFFLKHELRYNPFYCLNLFGCKSICDSTKKEAKNVKGYIRHFFIEPQ